MLGAVRMHEDQLDISQGTVEALIANQFPQWAGLPIRPVPSHGTVNVLFRLGEDLVLRFPMQDGDPTERQAEIEAEAACARRLLGRLPVPTPEPVAFGAPGHGYPLPWAVYRWLRGTVATSADVADSDDFARDLAGVVTAIRSMDTQGQTFQGDRRGGLLSSQDGAVAVYLDHARGLIDTDALTDLWERLRVTPRVDSPDVWTHGDLMPGNLLTRAGRLTAVIDVAGLAPADPALDLQPAWNLLAGHARRTFREALNPAGDEWERGKGWAMAQAVGSLAYYRVTNPVMSQTAHRTLTALLLDEPA